jgi:hypothetical protein
MPYGVAGIEEKIAAKKTAAWGTALACGASSGFLFLPSSIKKSVGFDKDDSLGLTYSKDGMLGGIDVAGDLPAYLRYDSLDLLLAMFMGTAGAPTQQGATAAYAYAYTWADNLDGLFVVIAQYMKNFILEYPSVKIVGLTIKGERGKALQVVFKVIAINKVWDSAINTTGTFANVTIPDVANRVLFSQGVIRMNAQTGIALATGDKIYPTSFELSAQRKLKGAFTGANVFTSGSNSQDLIDEPINDDFPEITLKLTFPRLSATTNLTLLSGDTRQKLDMTFTGGLIASTYYRTFKIECPNLQLMNDDPADEKGAIKEPLEFAVHGCAAAPTGMTGITTPFKITGINTLTTNPLA